LIDEKNDEISLLNQNIEAKDGEIDSLKQAEAEKNENLVKAIEQLNVAENTMELLSIKVTEAEEDIQVCH
jgi:uncharacterized protein (DUF3084 family)